MIRQAVVALVLLGVAAVPTPAFAEGDVQPQDVGGASWTLWLNLEMPGLEPPVLQWAVLDEDPVPGFAERTKGLPEIPEQTVAGSEDVDVKSVMRSSQLEAAWDSGFRKVTGDKVCLLTDRQGVSHTHASAGPARTQWIATKAVDIYGRPVCWCVPVDVEVGNQTAIVLSADNALDLQTLYRQAVAEQHEEEGDSP